MQEWFWNVQMRLWGPPTAAVSITLADDEAGAGHVLRFEPSVSWARAHAAVVHAAARGDSIWFAQ